MYASIRRYHVDPASINQVVKRIEEGFLPILSGGPGFKAYCVVDAGEGVVATISVFESQAGAEESTKMAASWVKENLAALLPNPPQITAGSVKVFKVA